jgi:hypothetical protein
MIPPPSLPPSRFRRRHFQSPHLQELPQPFQLKPIHDGPFVHDQSFARGREEKGLGTVVPSLTTTTTAMAAAAASTALVSSNTTHAPLTMTTPSSTTTTTIPESDTPVPLYDDDATDTTLDDSFLPTYILDIIDPNPPAPPREQVPYWYDSPHFRPDV